MKYEKITSREVMESLGVNKNEAAVIMKARGWERHRYWVNGKPTRGFRRAVFEQDPTINLYWKLRARLMQAVERIDRAPRDIKNPERLRAKQQMNNILRQMVAAENRLPCFGG